MNLKEYPNAEEHYASFTEQAVERTRRNLLAAGIEPSPTLAKALAQDIFKKAYEDYQEQTAKVFLHNLAAIEDHYAPQIEREKQKNWNRQKWVCSLMGLIWAAMAVFYLAQHAYLLSIIYGAGVVVWVVLLSVWRPRKKSEA